MSADQGGKPAAGAKTDSGKGGASRGETQTQGKKGHGPQKLKQKKK